MRGAQASKRTIVPDPVYNSVEVTKLVNTVMLHGKKSTAQKLVYQALEAASKKVDVKPLELLEGALNNVKPGLEIRSRRVGGANYQVPVVVPDERQVALALRWIIVGCRKKKGQDFVTLLGDELVSAYKGEGDAVRQKTDTERMAEANKAFAHFRW